MLKLKLQYLGHLMRRVDSLVKTLMLGGIGGRWRRGQQRMRWLDGVTDSMAWVWVNSRSWWRTGRPGVLWFMGSQESDTTEWLNWAEQTWTDAQCCSLLEKCYSKLKMRYHLTLVRMAIIKKSTNNKCRRGRGEKGTLLHCWWECKLIKPLWKTVCRFL